MGNFVSTSGAAFTPSDAFFLTEATRTGSLDVVRLFLKKNPALVYATDNVDASTPWHVAVAAGHDVVLRVLIDTTRAHAMSNNFDPLSKVINKQNAKGQTPLMLACGGGYSVCVRLLLESGAHLLVADNTGRSALHYAALHNGADGTGNDCVELLLAHMQQQLLAQGPVAAPLAVHANVVRKFADTGDVHGRTAMHCAAWSGNTRAVHALWAVGADICARTVSDCYESELPCNNGTTPLHFAAMRGHQPVVVLLLAAWHRAVSRPGAPLPPAAFCRLAPTGASVRVTRESEVEGGVAVETEREEERASGEVGTCRNGTEEACEQQPSEAGVEQRQSEGEAGRGEELGGSGGDRDGSGLSPAAAAGTEAEAAAGTEPAGAPAEVEVREEAKSSRRSEESSNRSSIGGGRSSGGDGAGFIALSLPLRLTLEHSLPPPPSPRAPAGDPRLMVDAYGMTPYTIACKRKQDRGAVMLIELLDPSTDFFAGGEQDAAEKGTHDGGGAGPKGSSTTTTSRGYNGIRGAASGGYTADDDDDSEDSYGGGVAGPLLLWEGVELIQDIAARPEAFFTLQRSSTLLKQQVLEDSASGGVAEAVGLGLRGGYQLPHRRPSGAGGGGRLQGDGGGRLGALAGSGSGAGARRRGGPATSSAELSTTPDCFLCPLTCEIFRDPVVAADGVTYEREAIERHLRNFATSPVTKQRMASKLIYSNTALQRAIEHWRADAGGGGGTSGGR